MDGFAGSLGIICSFCLGSDGGFGRIVFHRVESVADLLSKALLRGAQIIAPGHIIWFGAPKTKHSGADQRRRNWGVFQESPRNARAYSQNRGGIRGSPGFNIVHNSLGDRLGLRPYVHGELTIGLGSAQHGQVSDEFGTSLLNFEL